MDLGFATAIPVFSSAGTAFGFHLLLVTQEAVHNALQHAEAGRIDVTDRIAPTALVSDLDRDLPDGAVETHGRLPRGGMSPFPRGAD